MCSPTEARSLRARLRAIGPDPFVAETLTVGRYTAKRLLTAFGVKPPEFFEGRPESGYYRLLGLAIIREITAREKLPQYNTIEDAVQLLQKCSKIMVITGAGVCLRIRTQC